MSLEQDYTTVPGQVFACLSIVGPDAPQKADKFGIKIRGAFSTRDEAARHAQRLQKEDATFDIYVVDMYKWLLIPPDSDKIDDVHYANEKLDELMTGYRENQSQAARMFNERKQGMIETKNGAAFAPGDENSKFYTGEHATLSGDPVMMYTPGKCLSEDGRVQYLKLLEWALELKHK